MFIVTDKLKQMPVWLKFTRSTGLRPVCDLGPMLYCVDAKLLSPIFESFRRSAWNGDAIRDTLLKRVL